MAHYYHYLNDYDTACSTAIDIQRFSLSLSLSLSLRRWGIYLERESSVIGYMDGG